MERLETIFGSEREARIAQGLLQTLSVEDVIVASELTKMAQPTIRGLIKDLSDGPKIKYIEMFTQLINNGYAEVTGLGLNSTFGFSSVITMPEDARTFFAQHYMVQEDSKIN